MKRIIHIVIFLCCWGYWSVEAQTPTPEMLQQELDRTSIQRDTNPVNASDSTLFSGKVNPQEINISDDALDAPIDYLARDSIIYDIKNKKIYLFGEASVSYQEIDMKAGYIEFDYGNNLVFAEAGVDSLGRKTGVPEFKQGEQTFSAGKLKFNFKNKKGIIYDVTTKQNDMFVRGGRSKFVGAVEGDTTSANIIYSEDAIFTTCSHPEPHYGIRSRKQKVIPNDIIVVGPSNIEIAGIPTPLWLPFGFFPITKGKKQGILFPRDYEYSPTWGYGIRNLGYYFPIGEYYDLSLTGDIYLKGTWGIQASSNFRKRYKYNGNITLGYSRRRSESTRGEISFEPSFNIRANINQDSRAHPAIRFGGNVNIQGNGYQQLNRNDAQSVLQNQLSSNLNFTHSFPGKPYTFSASLNHSQNTRTRQVTINFPTLNFQLQTIYPFKQKKKKDISKGEQWYERIALQYRGEAKNRFVTTDTTFFSQQTLADAQFGARHTASLNNSFKVLKYFNLNPSVNYDEVWHFKSIEKNFDPSPVIETDTLINPDGSLSFSTDTLAFGTVEVDTLFGFRSARQFTTSLSLNTQIFGTLRFKGNGLKGIRHVVKPSLAFNYTPDYTDPAREYYDFVQTDARNPEDLDRYSVFEGNIYSGPPANGRQMSLSYSITNIFEAKYYSKKDSTDKKLKLFDNIYVRGNYNFARDTLKFSQTNVSGTTRFFKGMTTLNLNATFDPYAAVANNGGTSLKRIDRFYFEDTGKILRFVDASLRLGTTIRMSEVKKLFDKLGKEEDNNDGLVDPEEVDNIGATVPDERPEPVTNSPRTRPANAQTDKLPNDDLWSLFERFSIRHNLVLDLERTPTGKDTLVITTHSLNMNGNLQLTPKWSVRVGNFGYDFKNKRLTYPDFGVSRNLHCWLLSFNWQPVRNTYSMTLQVSPGSTLDFLKIPYNRNNADGQRFGGF